MARQVQRIDPAVIRMEGDGFDVRRAIPLEALPHVNPFLLVEEIEPVTPAAEVRTAQRPARGFDEVTWVLTGAVEHIRRERGADVTTAIAADRAEWLTTGRGDLYLERFPAGAEVRMVRIWIALPRNERRVERQILVEQSDGDTLQMWTTAGAFAGNAEIDLLAGRLFGARARIHPRTRVTVARVRLPADTTFVHAVDSLEVGNEAPTVLLFALSGQAMVGPGPAGGAGEQRILPHELAILTPPAGRGPAGVNSDEVRIRTTPGQTFDFLWLSGTPVGTRAGEPFVRHGSIVMRSEEEILQTIEDYRTGHLGTLV